MVAAIRHKGADQAAQQGVRSWGQCLRLLTEWSGAVQLAQSSIVNCLPSRVRSRKLTLDSLCQQVVTFTSAPLGRCQQLSMAQRHQQLRMS